MLKHQHIKRVSDISLALFFTFLLLLTLGFFTSLHSSQKNIQQSSQVLGWRSY